MTRCLLGCGVTTASARSQHRESQEGDSVAIFGLGGIGLAALQGHVSQSGRIIAMIPIRRNSNCEKFGATECLNPNDLISRSEVIIEMPDGLSTIPSNVSYRQCDACALESSHRAGDVRHYRRRRCGKNLYASFQLVTGRVERFCFRWCEGRSELPGMVEDAMR